jgi:ketosteroid isomerase-like protein
MMKDVPAILDRYVAATNAHDPAALSTCFSPDAVVLDEGKTYRGRAEILGWKEDVTARYKISNTPLDYEWQGETLAARMRVEGTFPGSPTDLTYLLEFKDGLISSFRVA